MSYRFEDPIRVDEREELAYFANEVGTRLDWHEPDEQDLTALHFGRSFDNAGFWGTSANAYQSLVNEQHIVLYINEFPVIAVNLATLFARSEEHTSELQSRPHLVCRLLLEKKKQKKSRKYDKHEDD